MTKKDFLSLAPLLALVILMAVSWGLNIYKLANSDFEPSYKEEVIRALGVPVVPLGMIVAYIDFEQPNNTNDKE